MKIVSLALLVHSVLGYEQNSEENVFGESLRHIELAPNSVVQMSFEEILELKRLGITFLDVTGKEEEQSNQISSVNTYPPAVYPINTTQRELFDELSPMLSKESLESNLIEFTSFYTRYAYSEYGVKSCNWLYDRIAAVVQNRSDVSINVFPHKWLQSSILVTIDGEVNNDKVIVVGAHQDSLNLVSPSLMPAPGADDDASGAMTTFEVFRILMESGYKPKTKVEFHWYSAEELGLLGSQDVFQNYSEANVNVRAMLQQDMTGYSAGSYYNVGHDELGLITDYVDPALTDYLKMIIDEYCSIPYVETTCGYGCSDHASASKYGYQSAFVIESAFQNVDRNIHTTEDTVATLDLDHMMEHAKLTLGYVLELGAELDI